MAKKLQTVGLGGTFDHFHLGHQRLLDGAGAVGQKLLVGITTDTFAQQLEKQHSQTLESYEARSASVAQYCKGRELACELFPLDDPYGPTLTAETEVDILCVSADTKTTADELNQLRVAGGLQELPVEVVPLVKLSNGETLSSTLIRQGLVSRAGDLYETVLENTLTLTKKQRAFFSELQGELVQQPSKRECLRLVVGDSSLQRFLANGWHFDLAVFDYQIGREPYEPPVIAAEDIDIIATNPAGSISTHLTSVLRTALQKKMRNVFVEGEEDLAAVVMALIAPLGAEIYYGQPDEGLVCIQLTEEKKNKIYKILLQ